MKYRGVFMSSKCIRDTVNKVKAKYQESDPYRLAAANLYSCTMSRKARTETPESMHSMTVQYALNHRYLQPQRNYHQQHTSMPS